MPACRASNRQAMCTRVRWRCQKVVHHGPEKQRRNYGTKSRSPLSRGRSLFSTPYPSSHYSHGSSSTSWAGSTTSLLSFHPPDLLRPTGPTQYPSRTTTVQEVQAGLPLAMTLRPTAATWPSHGSSSTKATPKYSLKFKAQSPKYSAPSPLLKQSLPRASPNSLCKYARSLKAQAPTNVEPRTGWYISSLPDQKKKTSSSNPACSQPPHQATLPHPHPHQIATRPRYQHEHPQPANPAPIPIPIPTPPQAYHLPPPPSANS